MTDEKSPDNISDADLEQVTGGFGGAMGDEYSMAKSAGPDAGKPGKVKPGSKGVLSSLQTG